MNEYISEIPEAHIIQHGTMPLIIKNGIHEIQCPDDTLSNLDFDELDIVEPDYVKNLTKKFEQIEFENNKKCIEMFKNEDTDSIKATQRFIFENGGKPNGTETPTSFVNTGNGVKKYHIVDMFLLINESNDNIINIDPNLQVQCVILSFNIDFGNIRVTFNQMPSEAIYNNVVYNQSLKNLIVGTIYPSSAFKLLYKEGEWFTCIEQLITNKHEQWEKERPIVVVRNNGDSIEMRIIDVVKNIEYYYKFIDWQLEALKKCLSFTYEKGMQLRGQLNII